MAATFSPIRTGFAALDRVQDALAAVLTPALRSLRSHADAETPAGPCDGANVTFRLDRMPDPAESLMVLLASATTGAGTPLVQDVAYTLKRLATGGAEITMTSAPASTTTIRCWYRF